MLEQKIQTFKFEQFEIFCGDKLNKEVIKQIFDDVDSNKDGEVSFEEFKTFLQEEFEII